MWCVLKITNCKFKSTFDQLLQFSFNSVPQIKKLHLFFFLGVVVGVVRPHSLLCEGDGGCDPPWWRPQCPRVVWSRGAVGLFAWSSHYVSSCQHLQSVLIWRSLQHQVPLSKTNQFINHQQTLQITEELCKTELYLFVVPLWFLKFWFLLLFSLSSSQHLLFCLLSGCSLCSSKY